ncbi:hypothetical protein JHK82_033955 [Glycine max]|nr:hypothetical protein JHK85_034663 [Glycine max]KAG5119535.1 hypothetical protein JHK82_033955 [Glycine max]KAG5140522.1 hypothetical protein JHK84_034290 [Glycine max]
MNYYPPFPNPELTVGVGHHSDFETITLCIYTVKKIGIVYKMGKCENDEQEATCSHTKGSANDNITTAKLGKLGEIGHWLLVNLTSKVTLVQNVDVPDKPYDFVHTSDMVDGGYDSDYLLDVMAMLTGVGIQHENESNGRKSKMNIIQLEADGSFVGELNAFLASGEVDNVVAIVKFAKVKSYQDFVATKVLAKRMLQNMDSPCVSLSQLSDGLVSAKVDFLDVTQMKKIEWIKDCEVIVRYNVPNMYIIICITVIKIKSLCRLVKA